MSNKRSLVIAIGYTLALLVVSLLKFDALGHLGPSYKDKIFHFLAYALLTLVWYNVLVLRQKNSNVLLIAAVLSVSIGIVIEVLQGITGYRDTSVMDALANTLGVMLMSVILIMKQKTLKKDKSLFF